MKTNFHTHTTYCDGKNTPEEIVLAAIENGFDAIGFSGHAYTDFDLTYCMKDTAGYIREISGLKAKYGDKIQVYLGIEEDAFCLADRSAFDYIIGSSHYIRKDGKYYPIDSSYECLLGCLELFGGDVLEFSEAYYEAFCSYIISRKPNIIGHFDLITKFDEMSESIFLDNEEYVSLAEKYLRKAAETGAVFEVNTGAVSRGYRRTPYPQPELLYVLRKSDAKIMLSSDSHSADTLDFAFEKTKTLLRDVGFEHVYTIYNNELIKDYL